MFTEASSEQLRRLESIKKEFGSAARKKYRINRTNGHMHVILDAQAGVWQWTFDRDGEYRSGSLEQTLPFEDL